MQPLNLHDFEARARELLDPGVLAYVEGGALDEITLRENAAAFQRRRLRPRVLAGAGDVDPSTTLLGAPVSMPIGIAPTARQGLAHAGAELAMARAAAEAGVVFTASTMSTMPLETIAGGGGLRWFQLYVFEDKALTRSLIERATAAGYRALVLTVDTPVSSKRERDLRLGVQAVEGVCGNFDPAEPAAVAAASITSNFDPNMTWDIVGWLRSLSPLPVVLKGIVTAEDARRAVEHGVDAIWVSNHGGRQLDRTVAAIDALEEVATAAGGRAEVYVDGGVRRGLDAIVALALGARAVFIGRPAYYALACNGQAGVHDALEILRAELINAMALAGAPSLRDLDPSFVR
jgi:4-hydroxymandelate oxidase